MREVIILDLYNSLIIGVSIIALIIITKIFNIPFSKIMKLIINSILGGVIIYGINQTTRNDRNTYRFECIYKCFYRNIWHTRSSIIGGDKLFLEKCKKMFTFVKF